MGISMLLMTEARDWVESMMLAVADEAVLDGVYICRDAASALRLGSHHDPDVVIVDARFGEVVATDVIRELRRELTPGLYLLLTDEHGSLARRQALSAGARDYLAHDLTPEQVSRFIGHLGAFTMRTRTARTHPVFADPAPATEVAVSG
ncbi:MAG: hypothetical protein ACQERG_05320 [Pseudomonadota bacterium]